MGKLKVEITKYICDRCGHKWIPRGSNEPKVCPKCKSPYWNVPRKKWNPRSIKKKW